VVAVNELSSYIQLEEPLEVFLVPVSSEMEKPAPFVKFALGGGKEINGFIILLLKFFSQLNK